MHKKLLAVNMTYVIPCAKYHPRSGSDNFLISTGTSSSAAMDSFCSIRAQMCVSEKLSRR